MPEFRAPGRVNLIGDHTDYNEGYVLPLAIDLECRVRSEARDDGLVRLRSVELGSEVEVPADGSADPPAVQGWGRYVAGVVRVLAERGRPPVGLKGELSSTVPVGSGLSSSAALEVAVALALCDAAAHSLEPLELARACQEAEHVATGVPCGIMDQLTSIAGRAGHALLIDCRSLEIEEIPLPPELAVLVVHTGLPRALADSAYAERRSACEAAAARLGLASLRDAWPEDVADDPRARHVVTENERVLRAAAALPAGDREALDELMAASHASLRDDFEVSTPELDALVVALEESGAIGARLTGGGFGGCAVALVERVVADYVASNATARYREATGLEPTPYLVEAAEGAGSAR